MCARVTERSFEGLEVFVPILDDICMRAELHMDSLRELLYEAACCPLVSRVQSKGALGIAMLCTKM